MGGKTVLKQGMKSMNETDLLGKLEAYGKSDYYPFHMPGHKRQEIQDGRSGPFPDPYSIDITEIEGFDNLHHPEGILKNSMEQAARIYGADKTYYLVNGSTCGILSAVCGTTTTGGRILIARNCHKSAYNGLILNRLEPVYLYPEILPEYGIAGGIRTEAVRQALEKERHSINGFRIQAVLLVSPTYEGIVSDIGMIAKIVHEYGIPLIVDEAHGAHFPFGSRFPIPALSLGADLVIQSLHKTLPSLTQTAVLHCKSGLVDLEKIEQYLGIFQSSSPSYLFMAGIERCIRYMDQDGRAQMDGYGKRMEHFFDELSDLKILKVVTDTIKEESSVFDWDMSKVVISTAKAKDLDGEGLGRILRDRYHLEMEMCAPEHIVAMTSFLDTEDGLNRFKQALFEVDRELEPGVCWEPGVELREEKPEVLMPPAAAMDLPGEFVKLPEAAGRISKEFVYIYPPGIPLLAPGERITKMAADCIKRYQAAGLPVQGLKDGSLSTILAVAES